MAACCTNSLSSKRPGGAHFQLRWPGALKVSDLCNHPPTAHTLNAYYCSRKQRNIALWYLLTGLAIEKLCESAMDDSLADRGSVVRAARCLLTSVTRVLLLADIVVVKQLLLAKDKVR